MLGERIGRSVPRTASRPQRVRFTAFACAVALAGACAPSKPPEKPPAYFRSPTLDYQDSPRSASDGEVMGANKQSVDDTLQASPTNEHPAPGWEIEDGRLVPSQEARQRGHGSHAAGEPGCEEPTRLSASGEPAATEEKSAKDPTRKALRPICKKH